jgi:hypothetical protein
LVRTLELAFGVTGICENPEVRREAFASFMYDNRPINTDKTPQPVPTPPVRNCYFGLNGLLDVLTRLKQHVCDQSPRVTAYLSLEHAFIARKEESGMLWEALWNLGGGVPVRLVFDTWNNTVEAANTLRGLLTYMQKGWLRLYLIKSSQKFFYTNISFLVEGIGIIVTTEPAGGFGDTISILIEQGGYLSSMSGVLNRFDKIAKPLEKHFNLPNTKDEAGCFKRLFEPGEDLRTVIDGANLLYMDAEAYKRLLKLNGIKYKQKDYRHKRFTEDKQLFETFLKTNSLTEILSLPAFDKMISSLELKAPDFLFHNGTVKVDKRILKNLFTGMLDCLERYGNLRLFLNHQGVPMTDVSYRLKGDRFIMLHYYKDGKTHAVFSDTWLLIYEYYRYFDEAMRDDVLVTIRNSVKAALEIRLNKLEVSDHDL